ncbi:MAG: hypothetical protein Q4A93_04625 [Actinomycetota bacterium]|jgi:hypothetical protein|nr:hypothetical protein [Actinomycetota bacterium]
MMQGEQRQELFRQSALDQVSAATGLDAYIKAVRPSTWLVAIAAVIAIAALLVWGFTAKVATTINDNGVVHDGKVVSYLTEQNRVEVSVGDRALVDNKEATVTDVSATPLSSRDAGAIAPDDYTLQMLKLEDWNYPVYLTMDDMPEEGTLVDVMITTDEVAPISFLLDSELGNGSS